MYTHLNSSILKHLEVLWLCMFVRSLVENHVLKRRLCYFDSSGALSLLYTKRNPGCYELTKHMCLQRSIADA